MQIILYGGPKNGRVVSVTFLPPEIIVPAVDIVNVLNAEHIDPDAVIETVVYRRKYHRSGEIRYVYEGDA